MFLFLKRSQQLRLEDFKPSLSRFVIHFGRKKNWGSRIQNFQDLSLFSSLYFSSLFLRTFWEIIQSSSLLFFFVFENSREIIQSSTCNVHVILVGGTICTIQHKKWIISLSFPRKQTHHKQNNWNFINLPNNKTLIWPGQ